MNKYTGIFKKKEYWIGVVAGVVLASTIGYFMNFR